MDLSLIISLAIAALIIVVSIGFLVLHLIKILKASKSTLNNVGVTVENVEKQTEGITTQTTLLTEKIDYLTKDFEEKSSKLDNLFYGLDELAAMFNKLTERISRMSVNINRFSSEDVNKTTQALKWGMRILNPEKRSEY